MEQIVWPLDDAGLAKCVESDGSVKSIHELLNQLYAVVEAYQTTPGKFNGVGIVITANDGLVGIDLDGCRDPQSGDIDPVAAALIEQFMSYTEISPSGTGVHIFVYGDLTNLRGNRVSYRGVGIEMYDRSRYFTLTGDEFEGTPSRVIDRQDQLADVHATIFGTTTPESGSEPEHYPLDLDAVAPNSVLALIEKNEYLRRIWDRTQSTVSWSKESPSEWCYRFPGSGRVVNWQWLSCSTTLAYPIICEFIYVLPL